MSNRKARTHTQDMPEGQSQTVVTYPIYLGHESHNVQTAALSSHLGTQAHVQAWIIRGTLIFIPDGRLMFYA